MGNINFVNPVSSKSRLEHGNKLVLNWWGGGSGSPQQKVILLRRRNNTLFLGFSASVALLGFGVREIIKNANPDDKKKKLLSRGAWKFQLPQQLLYNNQKYKQDGDGGGYRFPLLRFPPFTLLTPVACASSYVGEDTICNCSSANSQQPTSPPTNQNCDCNCDECRTGSCPCSTTPPPPPPDDNTSSSSSSSSTCSQPRKPACYSGNPSSTPPKISNKPCRHSSSSGGCSATGEIDINALAQQLGGLKQVDFVVETDLSHCFLIKQACQITVDNVTRILTETASAYEDFHEEYRRIMDMMMDALQDSRKACGADVEVIECKLVLIRAKVDEIKRRIADMDMFLGSLEKLAHATAETSFMSSAEYASIAMSERLQSLNTEVNRLRCQSKEKERDMLELQSLIIVESGKGLK